LFFSYLSRSFSYISIASKKEGKIILPVFQPLPDLNISERNRIRVGSRHTPDLVVEVGKHQIFIPAPRYFFMELIAYARHGRFAISALKTTSSPLENYHFDSKISLRQAKTTTPHPQKTIPQTKNTPDPVDFRFHPPKIIIKNPSKMIIGRLK
jgi:hypothetical protein